MTELACAGIVLLLHHLPDLDLTRMIVGQRERHDSIERHVAHGEDFISFSATEASFRRRRTRLLV